MNRLIGVFTAAALSLVAAPVAAATDYGPIFHDGLRRAGAAPADLQLTLTLGLAHDARGVRDAVRAPSPSSDSYGAYPSLHALAAAYGAPLPARRAVARVFRRSGNTAKADVTHQRMTVTIAGDGTADLRHVVGALPHGGRRRARRAAGLPPRLPRGLAGNVDIVAGLRQVVLEPRASAAAASGSPIRTGTIAASCLGESHPSVVAGHAGLFPNQLLTAYGVAPLRASGLEGQGARVAIVGEAPTPLADVRAFRDCFGLGGTPLKIHGGDARSRRSSRARSTRWSSRWWLRACSASISGSTRSTRTPPTVRSWGSSGCLRRRSKRPLPAARCPM